jgi:uncharacterized protein with PQ loop repeat
MNDFLSSFFGYSSIFCWFIVFVPQVYKNYKTKNASSVSMTFLLLWLVGDILNLIGAFIEGLLFTTILQGLYFAVADLLLMFQIWHYKPIQLPKDETFDLEVNSYLLSSSTINSIHTKKSNLQEPKFNMRKFLVISSSLIAGLVLFIVLLVNLSNSNNSTQKAQFSTEKLKNPEFNEKSPIAQTLGWLSAFLYWGSRVPQILKNHKRKSVEGLSMSMFFFCILGNFTFAASVFAHSSDINYIIKNLPWLLASGGTAFVDFIIFGQFYIYSKKFKNNQLISETTSAPALAASLT